MSALLDRCSETPGPSAEAPTGRSPLAVRAAAGLSVLALFLIGRPYFGIRHDARIYVGRAEADLGRAGMAQDLMFAHDGQSRFSAFGALLRPAVQHLGAAPAATLFTAVGLACWLAAATVLTSRLLRGAQLWAAMAALAVLPAFYVEALAYGEAFVTPRLFAEALGCLALACAVERRWARAAALAVAAGALHPIMTAPCVAVLALMLVIEDRRWFAAFTAGAVVAVTAAFAGAPLLSRLVTPIDPVWLEVLRRRSFYLFPALWSPDAWLMLVRQTVTLVIAARLLDARPRRLAISAAIVGAAGVAATLLVPTLLMIQAQPWRGQWIVAVLAAALLPVTLAKLWRAEGGGRAAGGALTIAWALSDSPALGALAALAALGLSFWPQARRLPPVVWRIVWAAAAGVLLRAALISFILALRAAGEAGIDSLVTRRLVSETLAVLVGVIAVAAILREDRLRRLAERRWAAAAACAGLIFAALAWNAQDAWTRARDAAAGAAPLRAQLPHGEIFWLDGDGRAGAWTDRPEWWSFNEGASAVFDRALALEWARRQAILVRAGLASPGRPTFETAAKITPKLTAAALAQVCQARSGPQAIIAPQQLTTPDVERRADGRWRAPAAPADAPGRSMFLIFRCAPAPPL